VVSIRAGAGAPSLLDQREVSFAPRELPCVSPVAV
jgi:hypothetical protein